jgi:cyclomaltodextrinase / maltogenic alpha-amylase / neopullulanase
LSDWSWENAEWIESAVIYGVIPRNFGPRGLADVTERLDDLRDLGVTALWLAPINANPVGDYGYRTINYFEIAPRVGGKEDLRRLVQEAHRRGIRVLMDFVPNHCSEHHRYFQDTLQNGPASPYWDFFDRDESGTHTHYFHWTYLPNLNFNNPKVVRWITEAFTYWVREFDVDGFRVDVAWGIRQRNPEYWPMCRQELKRIKPDILLLAEAGARDDYYFTEGFDAAYDWTEELGHGAWEHVFEDPQEITSRLHAALTNHGKGFHQDALILHFLNNNDTAERFLTRYGLGLTRTATALLLTLPGLPCLYTGDEIGAQFLPYKNPEPLDWSADPHDLRGYHQKLIALRKAVPALHSRQWEILPANPQVQIYAYIRYTDQGDAPVLVLLNFSETSAVAAVHIPARFQTLIQAPNLREILTDTVIETGSQNPLTVEIPPMTAYLLTPG